MNKSQCFACGVNKKIEDFRYVTKDQGVDRSAYYSCSTQCLLALANAEHKLDPPVPAVGHQGFWNWFDDGTRRHRQTQGGENG